MNPEEEFLPEWLVVGGPTTTTTTIAADDDDDDDDDNRQQHLLRLLNSLLNNANGLGASTLKDVRRRCKEGKESIERYSPAHFSGAFDDDDDDDEAVASRLAPKLVKLQHAKDFVWEELHTGDWKDAEDKWREGEGLVIFAYCRMCVRYARARVKSDEVGAKYVERVLKRVIKELDVGTLLAGDVGGGKTLAKVAEEVSERLKEVRKMMDANVGEGDKRVLNWRFECEDVENASEEDVEDDGKKRKREASEEEEEEEEEEKNVLFPILEKDRGGQPPLKVPKFKEPLSLETFMTQFYLPKKPCAMRRFCTHWPAHEKWKDPSYFLDNFGARAVPVEFGSSYSSENWKINVVTFEEFLLKHMTDDKCGAYLAQQTLADQFPKLLEDIREPEYVHGCFREEEEDEANGGSKINIVAKNFWIGPKNTVSPPHTDPRDNLFVQICGAKRVRLWKPLDTDTDKDDNDDDDDENAMNQNATTTTTMYPYTASSTENTKLTNTSKAGDISLASFSPRAFPRLYRRPFYDVQLDAGDALFIPKGWWHFVKSVSNSISVSYWW